jgi:hypothetical protein
MTMESAKNGRGDVVGTWVNTSENPWYATVSPFIIEECKDGVIVRHVDDIEGEGAFFYPFWQFGRDGAFEAARLDLLEDDLYYSLE